MHELYHIIQHTLGLCGEKHLNFLIVITEWPTFSPILSYIKTLNELGTQYNCNPGVIKKIIRSYNVPVRSKKDNVRFLKTSQILELHSQGYKITEIQKITHTNFNIVKEIINKNICQ